MADTKTKTSAKTVSTPEIPLFGKSNYLFMAIGVIVIAIGMILMAGGKSSDPKVFNYAEVYSTRRITIAPILIIIGIFIEMYAIFKKPTSEKS